MRMEIGIPVCTKRVDGVVVFQTERKVGVDSDEMAGLDEVKLLDRVVLQDEGVDVSAVGSDADVGFMMILNSDAPSQGV